MFKEERLIQKYVYKIEVRFFFIFKVNTYPQNLKPQHKQILVKPFDITIYIKTLTFKY